MRSLLERAIWLFRYRKDAGEITNQITDKKDGCCTLSYFVMQLKIVAGTEPLS